jgi:hypothetical protein
MSSQEPDDRTQTYQRKIQELYAEDAAAKFKERFWPADPYETGVLVNAADLAIDELVKVYAAAEVLHDRGDEAFLNSLILHRDHLNSPPMVRVNPLWIDARRQRRLRIVSLLYSWYWETSEAFKIKFQEIVEAGDQQLLEDLRQVEEALTLCWCLPMPVAATAAPVVNDSPTILIEQEAE